MEKCYIQFIQVTPEQLQEAIIAGLKAEIEKLKRDFSTQDPRRILDQERS